MTENFLFLYLLIDLYARFLFVGMTNGRPLFLIRRTTCVISNSAVFQTPPPVIPSEVEESRGNECGGLTIVIPNNKKERRLIFAAQNLNEKDFAARGRRKKSRGRRKICEKKKKQKIFSVVGLAKANIFLSYHE